MAESEVKAEEPVKHAGEKKDDAKLEGGKDKGKGLLKGKHKVWVYGLGGVALVVIFLMMKKNSSASTAASGSTGSTAIDPATGFPYGSAQDLAALSAQAGQSASGASGGGTSSGSSNIDPATGYIYGSAADIAALGGSSATTTPPVTQPASVVSPAATSTAAATVTSTPTATTTATGDTISGPVNGLAGESAPGYTSLSNLVALTFAQAQKLAGKAGSSSLYYSGPNTGGILKGQYANDKNVQYYTTPSVAKSKGV